ncbi:MAG: hypothetical protein R3181_14445, partial [Rubricoccaceae bacterium]|nr:hypothetical protein [Rubricoccaceae bacterium]
MRLSILVPLLLLAAPLWAQPTPGAFETGRALATLNANEVEATVFLGQNLFFRPRDGEAEEVREAHVVPTADSVSAIFAASLWLAGKVDGELRAAAARYDDFEFWPGPLGAGGALPSPTDCSAYDRIWTVSRRDIAHYLLTGEATEDLRDWPVALGAPVLDGDGIPDNYDLAGGDQPAIRGDQTAWWVMNDVGNMHESSQTQPMGVEVRTEVFAAAEPEADDGLPAVGRATFYRYLVTNRTDDVIEDAYASLFADPDLGYGTDDYVGSDSLRHLGYVYNADNLDESIDHPGIQIETGYGVGPPALGFAVLRGPEGQ